MRMALPTVAVSDRKVILLSGFEKVASDRTSVSRADKLVIHDEAKLRTTVKSDNDAVAFGYVAGKWIGVA
jgi:hypothetical protein